MALHTLTDDHHLGWICPHCQRERTAHISHEDVKSVLHHPDAMKETRTIQLPHCECGAQTHLKVDFTAEELQAPNMLDKGMPTPSYLVAHRHMELARRLEMLKKPNVAENNAE